MFQNPALVQQLKDTKIAEVRRDGARDRTAELHHDVGLRVTRRLFAWRSH